MKILREDGARLYSVKNPNPNIPDVEMWCKNHKDCVFCQHCSVALNYQNPKNPRLMVGCQLPSVSATGNNCDLHKLNKKQTCPSFKDIDQDGKTAVAVKKQVEAKKPEPMSFSMSKDGVKIKK